MPAGYTYILLLTLLSFMQDGYAQCPFPATLTSTGTCVGSTLTLQTSFSLTQIIWFKGSAVDKAIGDGIHPIDPSARIYTPAGAGNYKVAITAPDGCTITTDIIALSAPLSAGATELSPADTTICSGQPVTFRATTSLTDGSALAWQWLINDHPAGSNNPVFSSSGLSDGDIVRCTVTSFGNCTASTSNSSTIVVHPSPLITTGPPLSLSLGQSIPLQPQIDGPVNSWSWTPARGLSDPFIANPLASPLTTTVYTLNVQTAAGCTASGLIKVSVFSQARIPAAFTPNGDGRNDIFYVLGGPEGSRIRNFVVFNRWGQKVFQVADVPPGDPAFGWTGYYKGQLLPPGPYVYSVSLLLSGGGVQQFEGTVLLIR